MTAATRPPRESFTRQAVKEWMALGPKFLPFADAATHELPLGRLLRLGLFQISVGMATVLLTGTLNRVMIVEMGVSTWLVALMVSLPLLFAPFRALIGHNSDQHRSAFGWRRVPYLWYGSAAQFSGLAIMPFALLVMTDTPNAPPLVGEIAAAAAFLIVGIGIHTTQTAGLALATDIAPAHARPRVVALLYVMLLVGMMVSALVFGLLLSNYTPLALIQCIQGAAAVTIVLNFVALWKQEARDHKRVAKLRETPVEATPTFRESFAKFREDPRSMRLMVTLGIGTLAFSMQDIILEPYGGQVLHLSVSATTLLTAITAFGTLLGFAYAGRDLSRGGDPIRLAAAGLIIGILGFSCVIFASPFDLANLFRVGALLIGFGGGLFAVCMLISAMDLAETTDNGLALGAWGAVQATAAGLGLALGGGLRDVLGSLALSGAFGPVLAEPATGYSMVYHLEILLLFAALVALGPLARARRANGRLRTSAFGLAEMPG